MRETSVLLVLVVTGCTGTLSGPTVAKTWALEADTSGGLVDRRHPDFGAYPNAYEVGRLQITVDLEGALCASDGARTWCGGPVQGIPYTTRATVDGASLCMKVVDLFGNEVERICRGALPDEVRERARASCWDAHTASGDPCRICTDENGILTENSCSDDGQTDVQAQRAERDPGPGDEGSDTPEDEPADPPDSTEEPAPEPEPDPCTLPATAVLTGAELLTEVVNEGLARMGIVHTLAPPSETDDLQGFDEGDIDLGEPACADVLEYLDDEFGGDGPGDDDYVFGEDAIEECLQDGECRIGQLVTRSMADACTRVAPGCDLHSMSAGIIGGGGWAVGQLCGPGRPGQIEEYRGSPLVLDLDGDGLSLTGPEDGVLFALSGNHPVRTGWIAPGSGDALLAIDLDGDGVIGSGRELFGEATTGWAPDGFAALARHDANGDGWLDGFDPDFGRLLVWRDDGDGVTRSGELSTLAQAGVLGIPLAARRVGVRDASGNELGLEATARSSSGVDVPVVDVWFRFAE